MPRRKALPKPTPERIRKARDAAELTQAQAAAVVHLANPVRWSEYERGVHGITLAMWELFLLKTGQRELVLEIGTDEAGR